MKKSVRILALIGSAVLLSVFVSCRNTTEPDPEVPETYVHQRPAWSPDGLKIAFTVLVPESAGVYLVDSSGANLHLLKSGAGIGVTWSPDSKWLAFSVSGSLYKILATGDSLTQLTNNANDIRPSWSPDGNSIVYVNGGMRLLNLQDLSIMNLFPYGEYPSWNQNSVDILFLVFAEAGNNRWYNEFRTLSLADTSETVQISFFSDALAAFSSFNPAADKILMGLKPPFKKGLSQVFVASLVDISLEQLTIDGGDYPAWSPDGQKIVYMRSAVGDGGLWIMNADGQGKHRLTTP